MNFKENLKEKISRDVPGKGGESHGQA